MLKWVKEEPKKKETRKALMVEPKLHNEIKHYCVHNHITIKDFIDFAVMKEIYGEPEDDKK